MLKNVVVASTTGLLLQYTTLGAGGGGGQGRGAGRFTTTTGAGR